MINGVQTSSGWPIALRQGLAEGRVEDGRLFLWHGSDDITTITLASGFGVSSTAFSSGATSG